MKQIEKDKLCWYCYGCNKLEYSEQYSELNSEFEGTRNCKNFVLCVADWAEKMREELKQYGK